MFTTNAPSCLDPRDCPGESSRPSGQQQQKPGGRTCCDSDAVRPEDVDWLNVGAAENFCPAADPLPGVQDGQNLISWRRSLPLPTNPVWWGSMYAISSYRGNRPTNTHTNPQTGAITIHCVAASLASVKMQCVICATLHTESQQYKLDVTYVLYT